MPPRSLELTFVDGRPMAAYLRLVAERLRVARTVERADRLIVDFAEDGAPIGVEIIAFGSDVPDRVSRLLEELGVPPLSAQERRRLQVA